jgi:Putative restriction endonuclease
MLHRWRSPLFLTVKNCSALRRPGIPGNRPARGSGRTDRPRRATPIDKAKAKRASSFTPGSISSPPTLVGPHCHPAPMLRWGAEVPEVPIKTHATIEDLYHVPENGKAEIVGGELRLMSPMGALPNRAAGEIFVSLRAHARRTGVGRASTDNAGFVVDLPNRKSFSPDAAYHLGGQVPARCSHLRGGSAE